MKKNLIICILFLFIGNKLNAQKQKKALKFIETTSYCWMSKYSDNELKLDLIPKVSDEVIPIEISLFSEIDLSKFVFFEKLAENKKNKFDFDKDNFFEPFFKPSNQNGHGINNNYIAFFSIDKNDILMVDLFHITENNKINYKYLTTFGYCIRFLFQFDNEGDIEQVITTKVAFN